QGPRAVRPAHRRVPGRRPSMRRHAHRRRRLPLPHLSGGVGPRPRWLRRPRGGGGQGLRQRRAAAGDAARPPGPRGHRVLDRARPPAVHAAPEGDRADLRDGRAAPRAGGAGDGTVTAFAARLRDWAGRHPHKTAAVDGRRRLTYAELDVLVDRVAAGLDGEGVRAGQVVSSQLANGVDALALALAANRAGAVHNPLVTTLGRREVSFIVDQAESTLVVDGDLPAGEPRAAEDSSCTPDAVAFLLYTSGTE